VYAVSSWELQAKIYSHKQRIAGLRHEITRLNGHEDEVRRVRSDWRQARQDFERAVLRERHLAARPPEVSRTRFAPSYSTVMLGELLANRSNRAWSAFDEAERDCQDEIRRIGDARNGKSQQIYALQREIESLRAQVRRLQMVGR
jgi:predicted  nucleic acid-binding Zn-ribbon protein